MAKEQPEKGKTWGLGREPRSWPHWASKTGGCGVRMRKGQFRGGGCSLLATGREKWPNTEAEGIRKGNRGGLSQRLARHPAQGSVLAGRGSWGGRWAGHGGSLDTEYMCTEVHPSQTSAGWIRSSESGSKEVVGRRESLWLGFELQPEEELGDQEQDSSLEESGLCSPAAGPGQLWGVGTGPQPVCSEV